MRLLGRQTHTLERTAAGSYVAGVWTVGAPASSTFTGSLQPLSGRELERLPEGLRTRATSQLFTDPDVQLLTVELSTAKQADVVVTPTGRRFEIVAVEDWTAHSARTAHYRYLLAELGADEEAL